MRLRGPQARLELKILSHPRNPDEWCKVGLELDTPQGHWSASDNCLQLRDVFHLAEWLAKAGAGHAPDPPHWRGSEFALELSFPTEDRSKLRVYLSADFLPTWAPPDDEDGFHVDFPVTEKVLQQAAEALQAQLKGSKDNQSRRGG
jgi:hypothetical protein